MGKPVTIVNPDPDTKKKIGTLLIFLLLGIIRITLQLH
jgi:hypothetical protein